MIHSISFSNLGSFQEKTLMDMTWSKKDSIDDTTYYSELGDVRVSKVASVIGANASGKSSLLRTIFFIKYWIVDAWNLLPEIQLNQKEIRYRNLPFFFGKNPVSNFECVFETTKALYKIIFSLEDGYVVSETVYTRTKTKKRMTWKILFDRQKFLEHSSIRKNASIIYMMNLESDADAQDIISYWSNIYARVGGLETLGSGSFEMNRGMAITHYNRDRDSLSFVNNLLKSFDTGFSRLDIQEKKNDDGTPGLQVTGKASINGQEIDLPFFSDGTLKLVDYSYMIYNVLKTGGVLIFDELDSSFHPEILEKIVDLFLSKKHNPKNAQIIFSTHNPRIMNYLHRYQVFLIEKDVNLCSRLYRLDDVAGVRPNDNYYAKYMAGVYGAIPNTY